MPTALDGAANRCRAPRTAETPPWIIDDWRRYKATGSLAARNRLVSHYMTTHVRPIASRVHAGLPHHVEVDDLAQQGYLGLVDSMDRFDLDRDTRFETFSRRRIYGAIQDYLRSIDTLPRLARARSKQYQALRERFRKEHGRAPTDEELRPLLGLPEPVFRRFLADHDPPLVLPFSAARAEDDDGEGAEVDAMNAFEDRGQAAPETEAERRDFQRWLTRGLDGRDRLIIILYYYEHMTMLETGEAIGISESRVSQRLESILACLRARLGRSGTEHEFLFG